ncbi:MAG: hypothetical protein HRU38_06870 [Saccharospirillaceae bacterium]|nr:hypothetical protein [Saccharospirillaceae bacterium]
MTNKPIVDQVANVLLSVMVKDLQFHLNEIVDLFCKQNSGVGVNFKSSCIINEVRTNLIKRKLTTFHLSLPASFYFPMIKLEDNAVITAGSVNEISNSVDEYIQKIVFDDVLVFACVMYRNILLDKNCVLAVQKEKFRLDAKEISNSIMTRVFESWELISIKLECKLH